MSNHFFKPLKYPLMNDNKEIGYVTIDVDKEGKYVFDVDFLSNVTSKSVPWAFRDKYGNILLKLNDKRLRHRVLQSWLEDRVFPPDRHNAEELLEKMGLTEYDLLNVLKHTNAKNRYDKFWINFRSRTSSPNRNRTSSPNRKRRSSPNAL